MGCAVTIHLQTCDDAATLILEDTGPGFDLDVILHLFERRVKGKESNGHGLGLAFIDAVVRAHDGTIAARNREEGGAQITVVLPAARRQFAGQLSTIKRDAR
jgi:signal transduction histidine kinase